MYGTFHFFTDGSRSARHEASTALLMGVVRVSSTFPTFIRSLASSHTPPSSDLSRGARQHSARAAAASRSSPSGRFWSWNAVSMTDATSTTHVQLRARRTLRCVEPYGPIVDVIFKHLQHRACKRALRRRSRTKSAEIWRQG